MLQIRTSTYTKSLVITLLVIVTSAASVLLIVPSEQARAHPLTNFATNCASNGFFGLTPWFKYIDRSLDPQDCSVKCFNVLPQATPNDCGQTASDIPLVFLAIIDSLLRIAGLIALGYVIYAGFSFVTSQGNSDGAAKAQQTLTNALIGLVIAITSIAAVAFIGSKLGG